MRVRDFIINLKTRLITFKLDIIPLKPTLCYFPMNFVDFQVIFITEKGWDLIVGRFKRPFM